jgi:hypothetical protein
MPGLSFPFSRIATSANEQWTMADHDGLFRSLLDLRRFRNRPLAPVSAALTFTEITTKR